MNSRPAIRRRLAAVALSCSLMFAVPATASAEDDGEGAVAPFSAGQCAANRFCVWSGTGYSGAFWSTGSAGTQNPSVSLARTVWNRSGVAVRLYSGEGATGSWVCVGSGGLYTSTSIPSASIRTMTTSGC